MNDPAHFRKTFEVLGEDKVRERFALKDFGELEMKLAPEWLREKEQARALHQFERSEASQAEQASAASRAAAAAERANTLAQKANTLAMIANIIALAAMIVGGIALIKSMSAH